ncbi:MAG: AAA family ATPase [Pseudomonadota bacterium]
MISGCSGGGKSSLVRELAARGYATFDEPGRRVIANQRHNGGRAYPWIDMAAFAYEALALACADLDAADACHSDLVFFDRSAIDAIVALRHIGMDVPDGIFPYDELVFLAPPWPDIFITDDDRRHDFPAAEAEYERLVLDYGARGHRLAILPRIPVAERADFVLATI